MRKQPNKEGERLVDEGRALIERGPAQYHTHTTHSATEDVREVGETRGSCEEREVGSPPPECADAGICYVAERKRAVTVAPQGGDCRLRKVSPPDAF